MTDEPEDVSFRSRRYYFTPADWNTFDALVRDHFPTCVAYPKFLYTPGGASPLGILPTAGLGPYKYPEGRGKQCVASLSPGWKAKYEKCPHFEKRWNLIYPPLPRLLIDNGQMRAAILNRFAAIDSGGIWVACRKGNKSDAALARKIFRLFAKVASLRQMVCLNLPNGDVFRGPEGSTPYWFGDDAWAWLKADKNRIAAGTGNYGYRPAEIE